jgi:hypothetical protein
MEDMGAHINHVYGLTEVYGPYTLCAWQAPWDDLPPAQRAAIRSRQGVACTVCQFLDVVDINTGGPVPRDGKTIGEVVMPDEKWGEVPKAFVTPKPGATPTAEEIIAFCKENLARFKAPKAVEFIQLPKTSTGKIQKFVLREKEWGSRGKRVN